MRRTTRPLIRAMRFQRGRRRPEYGLPGPPGPPGPPGVPNPPGRRDRPEGRGPMGGGIEREGVRGVPYVPPRPYPLDRDPAPSPYPPVAAPETVVRPLPRHA